MTPTEIRQARIALGLTQLQLSKRLGYRDKGRVSELERGVFKPGAAVVLMLRAHLAGYAASVIPTATAPAQIPDALGECSQVGSPGVGGASVNTS